MNHSITPNINILVSFFMHMFDFVDNFLQVTHRSTFIAVGIFGDNGNIIIFKIVIIRTFSIATRCKYVKTLISELCTLYDSGHFYGFQKSYNAVSIFCRFQKEKNLIS